MNEQESKLSVQILRAVIAVGLVLAILIGLRLSGVLMVEQDMPLEPAQTETGK